MRGARSGASTAWPSPCAAGASQARLRSAVLPFTASRRRRPGVQAWLIVLSGPVLVLGATAVCILLEDMVPHSAFGMVYLVAVVATAWLAGSTAAALVALLAFLTWSFLFLAPFGSFQVSSVEDVVGAVVFGLVALLLAGGTGRLGRSMRASEQRLLVQRQLISLARLLNAQPDMPRLRAVVERSAASLVGHRAWLILAGETAAGTAVETATRVNPPMDPVPPLARLAMAQARPAGRGTDLQPGGDWRAVPIPQGEGPPLAALVLRLEQDLDAEGEAALEALIDQVAIAMQRVAFTEAAAAARGRAEAEALRGILINTLGHDLRTPLTAIRGAAETLRRAGETLAPAVRADLLASIEEEVDQMTRWSTTILDLARLESGQLRARTEAVDLAELLHEAANRAANGHPGRIIHRDLPATLPALRLDPMMFDRVIANLFDNALKHTQDPAEIWLAARRTAEGIVITLEDDGPGIPAADLPHIFDVFFRASRVERHTKGNGLGLAICRGLVEAMGGTIHAESPRPDGRGTRLKVNLSL